MDATVQALVQLKGWPIISTFDLHKPMQFLPQGMDESITLVQA